MPEPAQQLDRLKAALTDRFTIEAQIGRGGMATVYRARDLRHGRRVAIKVLHPVFAATLGTDRFLLEIQIAATLHHPHILALYDSGEAAGLLYYVMPLVEGETLRERLNREKQLPLDDAVRIAREVADALSYAHQRGVIHRDVKPDNIMLESGHAMVADFGIARALSRAGGDRLTETGIVVGTPAYMSPEQASGNNVLDGRSDVYALACVVYEMLAGEPPFTGPTVESIVRQHVAVAPPVVTNLRPGVPPGIVDALQHAMAKSPADRVQSAQAFAEALERPHEASTVGRRARFPLRARAFGATAVLVLGAAALFWVAGPLWERSASDAALVAPRPASVAVLPFDNLSGDPENAYFSDGVTEQIINHLAKRAGLTVTSRTSAMQYRQTTKSVREVGQELQVAHVLEGSVQRDPSRSRVRISVQLINATSDEHVWAAVYDRDLSDIFAIQSEVAQHVASALGEKLSGDDRGRLVVRPTDNLEAYNSYLLGRFFWNKRSAPALTEAIHYYNRALRDDPDYAEAYAGLATVYAVLPGYAHVDLSEAHRLAREAALQALALDAGLAEAHAALGWISLTDWDWDGAARELSRATELSPGNATAHQWYALYLFAAGQPDSALAHAHRARELDPLSLIINADLGLLHYFRRDFPRAIAWFGKALEMDSAFTHANEALWATYELAGQFHDAINQAEKTARSRGATHAGAQQLRHELWIALASGGAPEYWRARAGRAEREGRGPTHFTSDMYNAGLFAMAGDTSGTFRLLERSFADREEYLVFLSAEPRFDGIRADGRFQAALRRIGFPVR